MSMTYLFYGFRKAALRGAAGVAEPFLTLFRTFLNVYRRETGDQELLDVLPPFLAVRAMVLAHPRWYPTPTDAVRTAQLRFAGVLAKADCGVDLESLPALLVLLTAAPEDSPGRPAALRSR